MDELLLDGGQGRRGRGRPRQRDPPGQRPGEEGTAGGRRAGCQQPHRCRTGASSGCLGSGRSLDAGLPPHGGQGPSLGGAWLAGPELFDSRGSGTSPFLSLCLWSTVPRFPLYKTGWTACPGPVRSVLRDGLCGALRTRPPSTLLLGAEGRSIPQAGSQARTWGSPSATHPARSLPCWTGSWAVGKLWEWAAPPCSPPPSPGKSRTVSLGNSPCRQTPHSPGQPGPEWAPHFIVCMERPQEPHSGVPTALYSLHGKALRAPPWCAHRTLQFTPFPDDHCLAQPQGPGAPGPDLSLSFRPPSWCPCPCLVPSGGLTRCWSPCGAGAQGLCRPCLLSPTGVLTVTGLSVVLNYCLPGQGGRRPPPVPGSCRWHQRVPQTALPLWGLPEATCPGPHPIVWPTRLPKAPQVHTPTVPWTAAWPWLERTPGRNLPALFSPLSLPITCPSSLPPQPTPSLTPFPGSPPLPWWPPVAPWPGRAFCPDSPFVPAPPPPKRQC